MRGVYLPGGSKVSIRVVTDPEPGPGQVLVRPRASTICGSDLRAIYREHVGEGAEAYQGVVAGHEPCGDVVAVGPGCLRAAVGDRVVVYHISGCGLCDDCRRGYQVGCTSTARRAYGWQRDGGHADLLLAEERDLLPLPDVLSYLDGACVACGFGTAYEGLCRAEVSGRDQLLVTGLGPVGLAVGLLARAMGASTIVGVDPVQARRELAIELGAVDVTDSGDGGLLADLLPGGAEVSIDCSGSGTGQATAITNTRRWGRCVLIGEGGQLNLDVSRDLIHRQLTLIGSWVSSTVRMTELLDNLARWQLHPDRVVTDTFGLDDAAEAYLVADAGLGGKVGLTLPALS